MQLRQFVPKTLPNGVKDEIFITNGEFTRKVGLSNLTANLVINGTFDTDTSWTHETAEFYIADGVAGCNNISSTTGISQDIANVANTWYYIEYDATVTTGSIYVSVGGIGLPQIVSSSGKYKHIWKSTSANAKVYIRPSSIGTTATIDNVIIKKILSSDIFENTNTNFIVGDTTIIHQLATPKIYMSDKIL